MLVDLAAALANPTGSAGGEKAECLMRKVAKSFKRHGYSPSHANLRPTTHRRGRVWQPLGWVGKVADRAYPITRSTGGIARFVPGLAAIGTGMAQS